MRGRIGKRFANFQLFFVGISTDAVRRGSKPSLFINLILEKKPGPPIRSAHGSISFSLYARRNSFSTELHVHIGLLSITLLIAYYSELLCDFPELYILIIIFGNQKLSWRSVCHNSSTASQTGKHKIKTQGWANFNGTCNGAP